MDLKKKISIRENNMVLEIEGNAFNHHFLLFLHCFKSLFFRVVEEGNSLLKHYKYLQHWLFRL